MRGRVPRIADVLSHVPDAVPPAASGISHSHQFTMIIGRVQATVNAFRLGLLCAYHPLRYVKVSRQGDWPIGQVLCYFAPVCLAYIRVKLNSCLALDMRRRRSPGPSSVPGESAFVKNHDLRLSIQLANSCPVSSFFTFPGAAVPDGAAPRDGGSSPETRLSVTVRVFDRMRG